MKRTGKRVLSVLAAAMLLLGSVSFAASALFDDEHTHHYSTLVLFEPGYQNAGTIVYQCTCGEFFTEPLSPITQPYCVMSGDRVAPGEEITLQAHLMCCEGLTDLSVDLSYNAYWLCLTGVHCDAYGDPEIVTDKALYFDSIDPDAHDAVLELTFFVDAHTPTGAQMVSVSGCGTSGIPVDESEQISLNAQTAAVTVYRPFLLTVTPASDEPLYPGDTVQMTVDLVNNLGVAGMALDLCYDTSALQLTEVTAEGMFLEGSVIMSGNYSVTPFRIMWDDAANTNSHTEEGTILTLTFTVRETASVGTADVWMEFDEDDVLDLKLRPVELTACDASLTIVRHILCDIDADMDVDLQDAVILSRYIAGGWNVQIDPQNADVNRDGKINLKDAVLIRRYLAGIWDPETV